MKVVKNKQTGNRLDKFSELKRANNSESHSMETWGLTAVVCSLSVRKVLSQHSLLAPQLCENLLLGQGFTLSTFLFPSVSSFCFLAHASFLSGILQPLFSAFSRISS